MNLLCFILILNKVPNQMYFSRNQMKKWRHRKNKCLLWQVKMAFNQKQTKFWLNESWMEFEPPQWPTIHSVAIWVFADRILVRFYLGDTRQN